MKVIIINLNTIYILLFIHINEFVKEIRDRVLFGGSCNLFGELLIKGAS